MRAGLVRSHGMASYGGRLVRVLIPSLSLGLMLATISLGPASASHRAHTRDESPVSTETAITASSTSTTYDTPITFIAKVTAGSTRVRSGKVTFIDMKNGSRLGGVRIQHGRANFSTSALAPGDRDIEAQYLGYDNYDPSDSAPVEISVTPTDDTTSSQIDPAHAGSQPGLSLNVGTLTKKWSANPASSRGSVFQDVLVADDKVFVSDGLTARRSEPNSSAAVVYALNALTGQIEWSAHVPSVGNDTWAALAYDGHTVFMLNGSGTVTAFDADSGHVKWSFQSHSSTYDGDELTAYDGMLFMVAEDGPPNFYGITEANGRVDWSATVQADNQTPTVDDDGVFLSGACQQNYGFSLSGTLLWHDDPGCFGGGGGIPVLADGYLYDEGHQDSDAPQILSPTDGSMVRTFSDQLPAVFDSSNMYVLQNDRLFAASPFGKPKGGPFDFPKGFSIATLPVTDSVNAIHWGIRRNDLRFLAEGGQDMVWLSRCEVRCSKHFL